MKLLSLAYLIEISIVLNLTLREFSQKNIIKKMKTVRKDIENDSKVIDFLNNYK